MKPNKSYAKSPLLLTRPGVTLLELAVIITVMLMLLSFLFPLATAWKKGSDRSACIMNIRNVQMGVRSFSNLEGYVDGTDVSTVSPPRILQSEIVGAEKFVQRTPTCPGEGNYSYGGNVIPPKGSLYLTCSLSGTERHLPDEYTHW